MPYIIDGNNLIGASPDISLKDADARKKILHLILKFQENKNNNIIVVFDGEPDYSLQPGEMSKKFTVSFPQYGSSADDEIKKILKGYNNCRDVILVTSDRELKSFAKDEGVRIINSIEFYYELKRVYRLNGKKEAKQKRIQTELSPSEVDSWLKIFNQE